jgi:hypothetical protein
MLRKCDAPYVQVNSNGQVHSLNVGVLLSYLEFKARIQTAHIKYSCYGGRSERTKGEEFIADYVVFGGVNGSSFRTTECFNIFCLDCLTMVQQVIQATLVRWLRR